MPVSLPGVDTHVGKSVFRKGKVVGCIPWSWSQLVRSSLWCLGFRQLLRLCSRRQAGSHGLAGSPEQSDLLFGGLQALRWAGVGKGRHHIQHLHGNVGEIAWHLPSSAWPQRATSVPVCVPKQDCSALPCPVWPGRIPVPCRLMFSLFHTHLPSRTSFFHFFPGISTALLAINPDPHGKSGALGALLLALTYLSPLRLCFPGDKKQVEGSGLVHRVQTGLFLLD